MNTQLKFKSHCKKNQQNLQILFESLLPYLSLEDLKTCRQLNSIWKNVVETAVHFARICNDSTIQDLNNVVGDAHMSIRVENLLDPIADSQISFASRVTLLFLEPFPSIAIDPPSHLHEMATHEAESTPTISFANFMKVLWSCTNVQRLILNQGALSHPQLDRTCFGGLSKRMSHLKHLGVILTGKKELQNLRYIFAETFPHLEFLSVCYRNIRNAENLESYVEVLMFILKHKETLRDIVISDPPMVPNKIEILPNPTAAPKKTKKRKKLKHAQATSSTPTTFQDWLVFFRKEFTQLQLHGIGLKFTENQFSSWGLGLTILENQKNLALIYLSRLPAIVAERLVWENSASLQVLSLKGIAFQVRPELSKVFNCACLQNCSNLYELELSDFYSYRHVESIPFKKLRSLQLLTYIGDDSLYGKEPLCNYDVAVKMVEELVVVEKVTLFRSSMMTCQLTSKICQLKNLQEITLLGFRGNYFNTERLQLLHQQEGPTVKHNFMVASELLSNPGHEEEMPFYICNDIDQLCKICSESSLCPSCVRIIFPRSGTRNRWDKLDTSVRHRIFNLLSLEDLRNARLVSRAWSRDAVQFLQYGFSLCDRTKDLICNTSLTSITYLAVANLKSIIPYERLYFARFIQTLVLEYNEEAFTKSSISSSSIQPVNSILDYFPEELLTIEKAFGVSKEPSIHSKNIISLLETCYNLETLFINQWALSNLLGLNRTTLKTKLFQKIAYRNLRCLHIVIHTSEVEAMLQFLNLDYNSNLMKLKKFCIQFVGSLKSRSMTEVYESIFKFIGFQEKLKELKIVDPIFASDAFKGRGDVEPAMSSVLSEKCRCGCLKIFQTPISLRKLQIIFKENPSKWNLGFIYLRTQKLLRDIWLEGLPVNEVHTIILNNANTVESIYVYGPPNAKKKSGFNFSYTKNCHKLRRLVVKNMGVENAHEIPGGVKILEIQAVQGKNPGWNISPSLSRVKSRVTVSAKVTRTFSKQFETLERMALINLGYLGLELAKMFLELPNLKILIVSHIHSEVLVELRTIRGILVELFNCNTNFESQATSKTGKKPGSPPEGVKITIKTKLPVVK